MVPLVEQSPKYKAELLIMVPYMLYLDPTTTSKYHGNMVLKLTIAIILTMI